MSVLYTKVGYSEPQMILTIWRKSQVLGQIIVYAKVKDVLLGKTETLEKAVNFDRFELENVITWWKKYATKRYDKMIAEGRVRKELEIWNEENMNKIDIIR